MESPSASSSELTILFEDPHLIVLNKPSGVPTQTTAAGEPGLEQAIRRHLAADRDAAVYLGTVHRLDRPVSGVLLWAKTPKAARRLSDQFARREASKEYWAVVEGSPPEPSGHWDDWLCHAESGSGRYSRICSAETAGARHAMTRFEVGLARRIPSGCSFLRLYPETGRTHQLRVQSSHRSIPILGDHVYEASGLFPSGIALHARRLQVRHPITSQTLSFEANLPDTWLDAGIEIAPEEPRGDVS